MGTDNVAGKRKRPVKKCPNPLFVHWLKEWTDDAAAKNLKSQYTYRKALNALQKYPLPLESGKACKVLECFGDKICKMLDDKLESYVAEYGTTEPVPGVIDILQPKGKKTKFQQEKEQQEQVYISSSSLAENTQRNVDANKARQKSGPKEYVPKYKTGGYAMVLTLYTEQQQADYPGFMTKNTLMNKAQPLCRKSFKIADPGSRYTAWSTMGDLRKKGFVESWSNPAKFKLTESGCILARKIQEMEANGSLPGMDIDSGTSSRIPFIVGGGGQTEKAVFPSVVLSDDEDVSENYPSYSRSTGSVKSQRKVIPSEVGNGFEGDEDIGRDLSKRLGYKKPCSSAAASAPSTAAASCLTKNERLQYWYIAEDGTEHTGKDKAQVTIEDKIGVGFLIKCKYNDLLMSGKKYSLDTSRTGTEGFTFAFLADCDAENTSMTPISKETLSRGSDRLLNFSGIFSKAESVKHSVSASTSRPLPKILERQISMNSDSQGSTCSTVSVASSNLPDPDFVLEPGTFDVILLVDMQEKASKMAQQILQPKLRENGINYQLRRLQIGDFLWIARPKSTGKAFGKDNVSVEDRELVLDYIVERKRMDDLASSIIDQRFKEQKFRLRGCGLKQAVYLVEDYGSAQHYCISEDALNQAITNTQVVDKFYVRRTKNLEDSITYLTIMTRYLQSVYSGKRLVARRASHLNDVGLTNEVDNREQYLMTYNEFSTRTTKNKPHTVREMFIKQLVQISGLTVEKACGITDIFPTPKLLIDSLETCYDQTDKDALLENIKCGSYKKNLGKQLAPLIAKFYSTRSQLT